MGSWAQRWKGKGLLKQSPPALPSPLPHPSVTAAVFAELRSLVKASQREGCEGTSLRLPTKAAPCLASGMDSSRGSGVSTNKGDRILPACPLPCWPLASSPAPLGGHGTLPSPVSNRGCAQPCPAEEPGAISAGRQGKGHTVLVSLGMENVISTAKRDANNPKSDANVGLGTIWNLGLDCPSSLLRTSPVICDPHDGTGRCRW